MRSARRSMRLRKWGIETFFFPLESGRTSFGRGKTLYFRSEVFPLPTRRKAKPCLTSFAKQNSHSPFPSTRVFTENSVSSASRYDGYRPKNPLREEVIDRRRKKDTVRCPFLLLASRMIIRLRRLRHLYLQSYSTFQSNWHREQHLHRNRYSLLQG